LGAKVTVPTLAGKISLTIPSNAKSGQKMRLKGRGLPGKEAGDQIVILQIMTPPADTPEAQQLYQQMAEELNFNPREALEDL
jgi:curved DNA-binding protein